MTTNGLFRRNIRSLLRQGGVARYFSGATSTTSNLLGSNNVPKEAELILSGSSRSETEVVSILREWLPNSDIRGMHMHQLLGKLLDDGVQLSTTEPFMLVMAKYFEEKEGADCVRILDRWGEHLGGNLELAPTLDAFHIALAAYGKSLPQPDEESPVTASLRLVEFLEKSAASGNASLTPTIQTYAHLLNTIFQNNRGKSDIDDMDDVSRMMELVKTKCNPENVTTEDAYYVVYMYSKGIGWVLDWNLNLGLLWFNELEQLLMTENFLVTAQSFNGPEKLISLIGKAYRDGIRCLSPSEGTDTARYALGVLERLSELDFGRTDHKLPWPDHYGAAMELIRDYGGSNAADVAYDLLTQAEQRHLNRDRKIQITMYDSILQTIARADGEADKAEALLYHVLTLNDQGRVLVQYEQGPLFTRMWNYVLMAHFHNAKPYKAIELFKKLEDHPVLNADSVTYSAILKALSRRPNDDSNVLEAARILQLMRDKNIVIENTHYGSVITMWARSKARGAALKAQELFDELDRNYNKTRDPRLRPLIGTYSALISAWARSRDQDAAERALAMFRDMSRYYETPDVVLYGCVIDAFAKRKNRKSAEEAEKLLLELESEALEHPNLRLNVVPYTSAMFAWSKSRSNEGPERAQAIMDRLEHAYIQSGRDESLKPDHLSYSALIEAWSKAGDPLQAERLIRECKEGGVQISASMYTLVMNGFWRSDIDPSAERVLSLLEEMEEDFASSGDESVKPDMRAYTVVIQALASSNRPEKATMAWDLMRKALQEFKSHRDEKLRPHIYSFNGVLSACGYTRGSPKHRKEAVRVSLEVIQEIQALSPLVQASSVTYLGLLNVFAHQLAKGMERTKFGKVCFDRACQEGLVSDRFLRVLERHFPELYNKLPRDEKNNVSLPPEWAFNASDGS